MAFVAANTCSKVKSHMQKLSGIDSTLICNRNSEWLTDLNRVKNTNVHFVAVGMNHLFERQQFAGKCKGIISDLKSSGSKVFVVE